MWAALLIAGFLMPPASSPRITEAQKVAIIRSLISDVGIARQPLPPDKHGVELSPDGKMLNQGDVQQALLEKGKAASVGDRVAITAITFKDDSIVFAINGGPHTTHWYDHVSVGMGSGVTPVSGPNQVGREGAQITLKYPGNVPELTPEEVRKQLGPLIDWDPPSTAEQMVKALPPSVKAAIAAHHVLVGMNTDMVVAAVGRSGNKSRETDDKGASYEDWVYGEPPAPTTFVRIEDDHVIRVTTYKADGTQVVDNTPDPALAAFNARQTQVSAAAPSAPGEQAPPTLRRPGDAPPVVAKGGSAPVTMPNNMPTDPGMPGSPTSPGMPPPGGPPGGPPTGPPSFPPTCCTLPR